MKVLPEFLRCFKVSKLHTICCGVHTIHMRSTSVTVLADYNRPTCLMQKSMPPSPAKCLAPWCWTLATGLSNYFIFRLYYIWYWVKMVFGQNILSKYHHDNPWQTQTRTLTQILKEDPITNQLNLKLSLSLYFKFKKRYADVWPLDD